MACLICSNEINIHDFQTVLSLKTPIICSRCSKQIRYKRRCKRRDHGTEVSLFERNEFIEEVLKRILMGDLVLLDVFYPYIKAEVNRWIKEYLFVSPVKSEVLYDAATVLVQRLNVRQCQAEKEIRICLIGDGVFKLNSVNICIISG